MFMSYFFIFRSDALNSTFTFFKGCIVSCQGVVQLWGLVLVSPRLVPLRFRLVSLFNSDDLNIDYSKGHVVRYFRPVSAARSIHLLVKIYNRWLPIAFWREQLRSSKQWLGFTGLI